MQLCKAGAKTGGPSPILAELKPHPAKFLIGQFAAICGFTF
jgi:hypothetical protein